MKRAAIVLTTGFEEIEAIAPMDILRRAGVEVDIVGVSANVATGSHDLTISTDKELVKVMNELYDVLILPGGMPGAKLLKNHQEVQEFVKLHYDAGKTPRRFHRLTHDRNKIWYYTYIREQY